MFFDSFVVFIIAFSGGIVVAMFLRMIFGNGLTYRLWSTVIPGIALLCTDAYIWALAGGIRNILVSLIVVPIGIGLMIVNFVIMGKTIVARVNRVVDMLKDIAEGEGDLTQRLPASGVDEVGQLSDWFNVFVEKIQGLVQTIASNVSTLNDASTELTRLSDQMNGEAGSMSGKSEAVAVSAEEMSSNMSAVSATMEESSSNVNVVATSVEEMTATVGEIAQNSEKASAITNEAVSQAQSASERVQALGKAALDITKVTETITEISEQTNLLALNATIESARAGEAGKGFAVVANEIKELAGQTARATLEIKEKISGIQNSSCETIEDIDRIVTVINNVNDIVATIASAVEEQSVATKEIAGNVFQTSQGIQEVNNNVAQSSQVSEAIAKDISEVNMSAGAISTSSSQVNLSAQELAKLASQLNILVEKFKV